jgi:hypothetical protein
MYLLSRGLDRSRYMPHDAHAVDSPQPPRNRPHRGGLTSIFLLLELFLVVLQQGSKGVNEVHVVFKLVEQPVRLFG